MPLFVIFVCFVDLMIFLDSPGFSIREPRVSIGSVGIARFIPFLEIMRELEEGRNDAESQDAVGCNVQIATGLGVRWFLLNCCMRGFHEGPNLLTSTIVSTMVT